jgi:DNA-binding GntR family transcriptional regulator
MKPWMNPDLKHRTLSAAIAGRLRQSILDGTHPAGAQLRQDALAESYAVSRIPVREALFQLEAEGLVRIVPHKGAIVSELSLDEINDVFDLRAMLEPRLLAASIPLFAGGDFVALQAIESDFEQAIASHDVSRWGVLNADLHMALYARAPQPRTLSVVAGLLQTSDRYTRVQLSRSSAMERAKLEHAALINLCRDGSLDEACAYLKAHIDAVRIDLLAVLKLARA